MTKVLFGSPALYVAPWSIHEFTLVLALKGFATESRRQVNIQKTIKKISSGIE